MDFHICWSIDCESCRGEVDMDLGRRAIDGFCEILDDVGWLGTLFVMPEEIEPMAELLARKAETGHELALHLHPDASGYPSGYLGVYSAEVQAEILGKANETFRRILGVTPVSIRPGFGSANDSTFPVLAQCGLRQSSTSFPGRKMSFLASNWAGEPFFAHYTNPHNRFLEGGLDFVEIPLSVDWETMIWGGIHPQDLRVEYTDAKNHGFLIRKLVKRQVSEDLPLRALVPFTHNLFDYSNPANFRRETMQGMVKEIVRLGEELNLTLKGSTMVQAADAYRRARPFARFGQATNA